MASVTEFYRVSLRGPPSSTPRWQRRQRGPGVAKKLRKRKWKRERERTGRAGDGHRSPNETRYEKLGKTRSVSGRRPIASRYVGGAVSRAPSLFCCCCCCCCILFFYLSNFYVLLNSTFRLSLSLSLFLIIGLFFFSGHRTSLRNDALVSFLFLLLLFSLQKKKECPPFYQRM